MSSPQHQVPELPDGFWYGAKLRLLGSPLVTEQLTLLIDYVVMVAVQTAAGSAAIVSAFPALSGIPVIGPKILLVISVLAILLMCLGNLRGIREAGRIFALPTYLFAVSVIAMIVADVVRELAGGLRHVSTGPGDAARARMPTWSSWARAARAGSPGC